MSKKKTESALGDVENMRAPNAGVQPSPGALSDVLTEDGASAFIVSTAARGAGRKFNVTLIDPFLLEELLDEDKTVKKIGAKADELKRWTPQLMEAMKVAVIAVFRDKYLPKIWDQVEKSLNVTAEYAMLRQVAIRECARLHEDIKSYKPRKK